MLLIERCHLHVPSFGLMCHRKLQPTFWFTCCKELYINLTVKNFFTDYLFFLVLHTLSNSPCCLSSYLTFFSVLLIFIGQDLFFYYWISSVVCSLSVRWFSITITYFLCSAGHWQVAQAFQNVLQILILEMLVTELTEFQWCFPISF